MGAALDEGPQRGNPSGGGRPRRELTLWDSVAIIVGIFVGAGIFETAPRIASQVSHVDPVVVIT